MHLKMLAQTYAKCQLQNVDYIVQAAVYINLRK